MSNDLVELDLTPQDRIHLVCRNDGGEPIDFISAHIYHHDFPRHFHDTYVIGLIEHGEEEFYWNGRTIRVQPGDLVLVNPGEVHTGRPLTPDGLVYKSLYPSPTWISRMIVKPDDAAPHFREPVIRQYPGGRAFRHAHQLVQSGDPRGPDLMCEVLLHLCEEYSAGLIRSPKTDRDQVQNVVDFIRDNSERNPSLIELGGVANLSPSYLVRMFRRYTGLPPHQFLLNVRIQKARQLMRRGLPLAQVAIESGFYDQAHFTRHFLAITGVTPGRYAT